MPAGSNMLHTTLECISPAQLMKNARGMSSQLQVSHDSPTICKLIQENRGHQSPCVWVWGQPGSGRTTYIHSVCQELISLGSVVESDILYIDVKPGSNRRSLYDLISAVARDKQDTHTASLLSQSSVKLAKKDKALQLFLKENFKLICVDRSGNCDDGVFFSDFASILDAGKLSTPIIAVSTTAAVSFMQQFVYSVEVSGLKEECTKALFNNSLSFSGSEVERICKCLSCNPVAIRLFANFVIEFNPTKQTIPRYNIQLLSEIYQTDQSRGPVDIVSEFVLSHLDPSVKAVLSQLLVLRKPLPLLSMPEEVEQLVRLTFLTRETLTNSSGTVVNLVSMGATLQNKSDETSGSESDGAADFSVLRTWMELLSKELQELVVDAENNAWPFIPEKWQYTEQVGAEQSYNINELITARNCTVPFMTEWDILQECLFHAVQKNAYNTIAALVFVTDRFAYWKGISDTSIRIVDYLETQSPETAVAPQLIIRKARLMKNRGDLQGAEQSLERLLQAKTDLGQWRYREPHEHQCVSAVCVEIKGDIQYNLGKWVDAAKLLLQAISLFRTLPRSDKKGLSSSLGILAKCFQNMTLADYSILAPTAGSPGILKIASKYRREAAIPGASCEGTEDQHPRACKFGFTHQPGTVPCVSEGCLYRLTSLSRSSMPRVKEKGRLIEAITSQLYEQYCSFTSSVTLDQRITSLIAQCLHVLGLQQFTDNDSVKSKLSPNLSGPLGNRNDSQVLGDVSADGQPFVPLPSQNADSKSCVKQLIAAVDTSKAPGENDVETARLEGTVDRVHATQDRQEADIQSDGYSVDQLVDTSKAPGENDVETARLEGTVDRVHATQDRQEADIQSDSYSVDQLVDTSKAPGENDVETARLEGTVDRVHATQDRQEADIQSDGYCVDRLAVTRTNDSQVIVDRSASTLSLGEEPAGFAGQLHACPQGNGDELGYPTLERSKKVHSATVWKYHYAKTTQHSTWREERNLAFIGGLLDLEKGKKGAQRDAFMVEFIGQDDPLAKYVAKSYRKAMGLEQYKQDVRCQMTARYYVTLFNQHVYQQGLNFGQVQFLPVALLQLLDQSGQVIGFYNVEPYMAGEFVKLTNNLASVRREKKGADLVLAFSHFTYQASNEELIIVDIQGWTPKDSSGCMFLTDPQIHSKVYDCFGTGNLRQRGFDRFWDEMHPTCNDICTSLGLVRPDCIS